MTVMEHVLQAKDSHQAMETLLQRFLPLMKKYAYKLAYEDALNDLQLNFIEMIHRIDLCGFRGKDDRYLLSYIEKSVKSFYIKCSRKQAQLYCIPMNPYPPTWQDNADGLLWADLQTLLSKGEYDLVWRVFGLEQRVGQLASDRKVSPQALSNQKKRVLRKIKRYYLN